MRVWELGFDRAPWYRALLMLSPAFSDRSFDQLAALSVGERNIRLFALRVRLFGSAVEAMIVCPHCATPLEFAFDLLDMCPQAATLPPAPSREFTVELADALRVACRPATSADLAAVVSEHADTARTVLAQRLAVAASSESGAIAVPALNADDAARIAGALEDADPFAETSMAFACNACEHEWAAPFDIVSFLWSELTTQTHRILEHVQLLAKRYGWSEGAILAMTGIRRRFYLDRAS